MADAKKVNYTPELTAQIVSDYQAGTPVDEIADTIGKSVRSVRSKLVREGVYVASEKKSAVKRKRAKPQGVGGKPTMVKTFKSKGGSIKPRGCGIAKRGFGKAMKGK